MSFTHKITQAWSNGGRAISGEKEYEANAQGASIDEVITADAEDELVVFTLDVSQVKAFFALAQGDMTLETNNGGAPTDTINLVGGVPYVWTEDSDDAFLLGSDVTALYMTELSSADNRLQIESVYDPTP